jgi:very-short-patch-repair endonuclease
MKRSGKNRSEQGKKGQKHLADLIKSTRELAKKNRSEDARRILDDIQINDLKTEALLEEYLWALAISDDHERFDRVFPELKPPVPASALYIKGNMEIIKGKYESAKEYLEQYLELERTSDGLWALARAYTQGEGFSGWKPLPDKDLIVGLLEEAAELPDCRYEVYRGLLDLYGYQDEVLSKKYDLHMKSLKNVWAKESDEARFAFAEFLIRWKVKIPSPEHDPKDILRPLLDKGHFPAFFLAFEDSFDGGRFDEALRVLVQIPDSCFVPQILKNLLLAVTHLRLKDGNSAIEVIMNCTEHDGSFENMVREFLTAEALKEKGETLAAMNFLQVALGGILPSDPHQEFALGDIEDYRFEFIYLDGLRDLCDWALENMDKNPNLENRDLRALIYFYRYISEFPRRDEENDSMERDPRLLEKAYETSALDHFCEEMAYHVYGQLDKEMEFRLRSALFQYERKPEDEMWQDVLERDFEDSPKISNTKAEKVYKRIKRYIETFLEDRGEAMKAVIPHLWEKALYPMVDRAPGGIENKGAQAFALFLHQKRLFPQNHMTMLGHACVKNKNYEEAKTLFMQALEVGVEAYNAWVGLYYIASHFGDLDNEVNALEHALSCAPPKLEEDVRRSLEQARGKKEKKQRELQRREELLTSAPIRWSGLNFYQKRILVALSEINSFDDLEHLGQLAGCEQKYMEGHWKKLNEQGFIIVDKKSYRINPHILDLIEKEKTHEVAIRLIRSDSGISAKPIFNSINEYTIYCHLVQIFPNHLVVPNQALQAIFQYERVKEIVSREDFEYYLKAMVDFTITSTATYMPILSLELDSDYHEAPDQKQRDARKDRIFEAGGVPLLRVRIHGKPSIPELRRQLSASLEALISEIRKGDQKRSPSSQHLIESFAKDLREQLE